MGAKEFASLLGGLALFLYGMNMMSQGMEAAAGNKMKQKKSEKDYIAYEGYSDRRKIQKTG